MANLIAEIFRSQWPRGLMRRSAAARLLRMWSSIQAEGMELFLLSVTSAVCCQVEISVTS